MKGLGGAMEHLMTAQKGKERTAEAYTPLSMEDKLEQELSQLEKRSVGGTDVVIRRTLVNAADIESKVVVHHLNKRSPILLSKRNIEKLVNDVKANDNKINEPILCKYNHDTGLFEAVDGSRRRCAAIMLSTDLPVEYFEEDLPDDVIKAHINSTNTSLDFSEYEKILIVKDEFEAYKNENPDASDEQLKDYFLSLLEDSKLGTGRSSYFKFKSIITFLNESYFANGRVNNISLKQLGDLSTLISRLQKNNPEKYSTQYITALFSDSFDTIEEVYGDVYTGKELLKEIKNRENLTVSSNKKTSPPKPEPVPIVSNEDCKITLLEHDGSWSISGDALMPKLFREQMELLIKEHFE